MHCKVKLFLDLVKSLEQYYTKSKEFKYSGLLLANVICTCYVHNYTTQYDLFVACDQALFQM